MPETSGYIIIVPASTLSSSQSQENDSRYVRFCDNSTLLTGRYAMPIFDKSDTVLFAGPTGKGVYIDVIDRRLLVVTSNDEVEELRWIEWRISFDVMNVGYSLLQSEGGIMPNAISLIERDLNKALIKASATGLLDETFRSSNSNIISTSLVGSERDTFYTTSNGDQISTDDKVENETFNTTVKKEEDDTGGFKIKTVQYLGFIMFIVVIVGVTQLTRMARDKYEWDDGIIRRVPYFITDHLELESDLSIDSTSDYAVPVPGMNYLSPRPIC